MVFKEFRISKFKSRNYSLSFLQILAAFAWGPIFQGRLEVELLVLIKDFEIPLEPYLLYTAQGQILPTNHVTHPTASKYFSNYNLVTIQANCTVETLRIWYSRNAINNKSTKRKIIQS